MKNKILKKKKNKLSNWVTLIEKKIFLSKNNKIETYHSFRQFDYCSILAVNNKNEVILVKQFRPAIEKNTIELPGGLVDKNLNPKKAILKELYEETGYFARKLYYLGKLLPDTGRHENFMHCFFSKTLERKKMRFIKDKNIEVVKIPLKNFKVFLSKLKLSHALHLALISLAIVQGHLKLR